MGWRSDSSSQVVRNLYSATLTFLRRRALAGSVGRRRLAVAAHQALGALDDLGEADHGHSVLLGERAPVDLLEKARRLLEPAKLGVVVLDVARRKFLHLLHLDLVDHRREDLLPRLVAIAHRNPDDLPALVLA